MFSDSCPISACFAWRILPVLSKQSMQLKGSRQLPLQVTHYIRVTLLCARLKKKCDWQQWQAMINCGDDTKAYLKSALLLNTFVWCGLKIKCTSWYIFLHGCSLLPNPTCKPLCLLLSHRNTYVSHIFVIPYVDIKNGKYITLLSVT